MKNKQEPKLPGKLSGRGNIRKVAPFGRIMVTKIDGGREISYHATKGWRNRRA